MIELFEIEGAKIAWSPYSGSLANGSESRREAERRIAHQLLSALIGKECRISHLPSGAPFVEGLDASVSISHCSTGVVVALCESKTIGIDVETRRHQLENIKGRFLSAKEQSAYSSLPKLQRAWTAKEALYKAALKPGLSLAEDIRLPLSLESNLAYADGRAFILHFIELEEETLLALAAEIE